ncbi:MFS transporter [Microbacterium gorillae]|uniref:MFS transporter n=1 Tax=Microbacterium gorillae TaxID=1231063 RepID=UPI00058B99F2|nr:MFS transporter [Microbacterium gorillae]
MSSESQPSLWRQPMQVWAVAFASVVAFMGIGLVDPILPAIANSLQATPVQTELLFTSYLVVTGLAMFFTSWVSSRLGAKKTLLIGLAVIVAFALACALSTSVDAVIGFRGGWGLGNALFISTALATIVGAAAGGSEAAIMLYEAALGIGIAVGPLLGGLLGTWSWRGPFFGVAILMAVAFVAITVLLKGGDRHPHPVKLSAPFRALADPALGRLAAAAVFYNIGFFTLLAFSPFILGFAEMGIGLTFFGWGLGLAITSVWVAPMLLRRFKRSTVLIWMFVLLALDLIAAGLVVASPAAVVVAIIVGGLVLGVINTTLTEAVMEATDLPRSVASSSYSAVRFLGGAIAPPLAAALWHAFNASIPFWVGALSVLIAVVIILTGRRHLFRIDQRGVDELEEVEAVFVGDAN